MDAIWAHRNVCNAFMNTTATRRGSPADFEICFAAPLPREYAQTLAVIMETELHTVLLYFRSNALKACSSRFSFFLFFIYIVVIIYRRFFHARYTWKGREGRFQVSSESFSRDLWRRWKEDISRCKGFAERWNKDDDFVGDKTAGDYCPCFLKLRFGTKREQNGGTASNMF